MRSNSKSEELFDETEALNHEGFALDGELAKAIRPIIEKYAKAGYSLRDICWVLNNSAMEAGLDMLLVHRPKYPGRVKQDPEWPPEYHNGVLLR